MYHPVGISSLAVSFPSVIRTNDYFRKNYPDLIATAEEKGLARAFSPAKPISENQEVDLWTQEMMPYLSDPFRGAIERRVLDCNESSLTLEYRAAYDALAAAKLSPEEVDLMIVASMFPEHIELGNAAFLAGQLGLKGAAWNLDSLCASALVALHNASALVRSGEYRNVLVVTSCTYSRFWDENDTLSFFVGDGAGAFVVSSLKANQGIIGKKIINTKESCGVFYNELTTDAQGKPRMIIRANKNASKQMPHLFVKYFRECYQGALDAANVTLDQIDFFVFYTATAWYRNFCVRELNIDPKRTIDIYPQYGNISAASTVATLYHAAQLDKIRPNDLVLVYNHGFVASAAAVVMRWGDVALGPLPTPSANLIDTPVRASGCGRS